MRRVTNVQIFEIDVMDIFDIVASNSENGY